MPGSNSEAKKPGTGFSWFHGFLPKCLRLGLGPLVVPGPLALGIRGAPVIAAGHFRETPRLRAANLRCEVAQDHQLLQDAEKTGLTGTRSSRRRRLAIQHVEESGSIRSRVGPEASAKTRFIRGG